MDDNGTYSSHNTYVRHWLCITDILCADSPPYQYPSTATLSNCKNGVRNRTVTAVARTSARDELIFFDRSGVYRAMPTKDRVATAISKDDGARYSVRQPDTFVKEHGRTMRPMRLLGAWRDRATTLTHTHLMYELFVPSTTSLSGSLAPRCFHCRT